MVEAGSSETSTEQHRDPKNRLTIIVQQNFQQLKCSESINVNWPSVVSSFVLKVTIQCCIR
jgi:hypothetical protein